MNRLVFGMFFFVLVIGLIFLGVNIDFLMNPWIKGLQLQWWNMFTTEHYFSWLYLSDFMTWLVLVMIFSIAVALILTFTKKMIFK